MDKSERHSKITGDFGESLLMYWLSKLGYETALVDHIGIDVVAYHKTTKRRLGISVKSRSRTYMKANKSMNISGKDLYIKVNKACVFFECEPWVAFIYDRPNKRSKIKNQATGKLEVFLLDFMTLKKYCGDFNKKTGFQFPIRDKFVEKYKKDPSILKIKFEYDQSGDWALPDRKGPRAKNGCPEYMRR